jgi:DNA repair protein RadA/Sms
VAHTGLRLKEAAKLGFTRAFAPASPRTEVDGARIATTPVGSVASLVAVIAAAGVEAKSTRARATGKPTAGGVTN